MAAIPFKEKQRNKRIRERVNDMYSQIVSEVDPENVFDLLIEKRVISIEQKQKFMIKVTRKECCRALLDHLLSCSNDESFIVLRDALEDQYPWIVERIDQCETDNETTSISDAKSDQDKMTQTESQEQSEDPVHENMPFDMEERLKKEFGKLEIENSHLEQKLEESKQGSKKLEQELQESRNKITNLVQRLQESRKENKNLEQKLEASRKEIKKLEQELQESRKETAEMKDQCRILKEILDKALDRERNLKKELDSIKIPTKLGIFGNIRKALDTTSKSSKPQLRRKTSSSDMNISVDERSRRKFSRLSSCCICSITLEENRMTPCFHIVCLKCLQDIQIKSNKKPGDVLPCPSCGKMFPIPLEGITGLQKDVFLKSPVEIEKSFNLENKPKTCKTHSEKVLDLYCKDCDTVACVSCFVENHKFHDCKDVTTIDKDFRLTLEEKTKKLSHQKQEMLSRRLDMERLKTEFLARSLETSKEIKNKSDSLKSFIDHHAGILLGELSTIEQRHRENMEREIDDIKRNTESLDSFLSYCTQMKVKGSASDVCCCACNLITTAEKLSKETEEYLLSPSKLVEIEFISTNLDETVHVVDNVIGKLSESSKLFDSKVFLFGIHDGVSFTNDIVKINLNRSEDVSKAEQIPVEMIDGSAAAVLCDSIFVTGIGKKGDEIWRFNATSSNWKKCASLAQGRRYHSISFVDHVLYVCGGFTYYGKKTLLDDVEAYDINKDQCVTVGKLTFAVYGSGNCVPFKSSLYIFGGKDVNDKIVNKVHVYDTKFNTCTLLSKPIPGAQCLLRAALWENTVILLGYNGCFTFNFKTQVWQVRHYFKTDTYDFGLIISNGLLFVIGGGERKRDADVKKKWICRDEVRCIPLVNILKNEPIGWRHHSTLPKPSLVYAFGKMEFSLK